MRVIIYTTVIGFALWVAFLVDAEGILPWCPASVFQALHYPAILISGEKPPASYEIGIWDSMAYMPLQWPIAGALVGVIQGYTRKLANRPLQRTPGSASVSNLDTSDPAPLS